MKNIHFKIGQPNTGKSYHFEEGVLKKEQFKGKEIKYLKIPVSGGVGNEYKGLQNTDLALSYDPINRTIKFGEFLKMLMSAILQPEVPHVVFLDDFHNQDISSLLSEYTPLFKNQQMRNLSTQSVSFAYKDLDLLQTDEFDSGMEFISKWNIFIDNLEGVPVVPISNRISGASLKLIFPSNFFLYGAANFNEKTTNIFADWADRANIEVVNPIKVQENIKFKSDSEFVDCCKKLNTELMVILEEQNIFDYERFCFGIWKVVDESNEVIQDNDKQKKVVYFFLSMIRNTLLHNNKSSYINNIGWGLVKAMQTNEWFKINIQKVDQDTEFNFDSDERGENRTIYKILHKLGIYEQ